MVAEDILHRKCSKVIFKICNKYEVMIDCIECMEYIEYSILDIVDPLDLLYTQETYIPPVKLIIQTKRTKKWSDQKIEASRVKYNLHCGFWQTHELSAGRCGHFAVDSL